MKQKGFGGGNMCVFIMFLKNEIAVVLSIAYLWVSFCTLIKWEEQKSVCVHVIQMLRCAYLYMTLTAERMTDNYAGPSDMWGIEYKLH